MKKVLTVLVCCLFLNQTVNAQDEEFLKFDVKDIVNYSDKFNFDQEIVSASKKSERLFDAPLSASVLTKEEIMASGATNIAEAMRLLPLSLFTRNSVD